MLLIYPKDEMPKVVRKVFTFDTDVFRKVRDFYAHI